MVSHTSAQAIKLFGLISPRKDLTLEAFHDHYRHPHGTLALTMKTLSSYVQSHRIRIDLPGSEQERFAAIAEIGLATEDDLGSFRSEPNLVRYLVPDEPNFIDFSNSAFLPTRVQIWETRARVSDAERFWTPDNRPISYKLIQLVRSGVPSSIDAAEIGSEIGALRVSWCAALQGSQSQKREFGAAREFWWPTLTSLRSGLARAPQAARQLLLDPAVGFSMFVQAERFI